MAEPWLDRPLDFFRTIGNLEPDVSMAQEKLARQVDREGIDAVERGRHRRGLGGCGWPLFDHPDFTMDVELGIFDRPGPGCRVDITICRKVAIAAAVRRLISRRCSSEGRHKPPGGSSGDALEMFPAR